MSRFAVAVSPISLCPLSPPVSPGAEELWGRVEMSWATAECGVGRGLETLHGAVLGPWCCRC